jgi:PAS domain S-box-containing protein
MSETAWSIEHVALLAAKLGAWTWDIQADRITWSDSAHEIFGLDRPQFATCVREFVDLLHVDDRPRLQSELDRALTTGADWDITYHLNADPERWIHARGRVLRDERGRAVRMAGVVQDVSAAYAAECERHETNALMQAALDASSFAVTVINPKGQIIYCNELGASLLGLTRSTAESRSYDAPQFKHTDVDGGPWPNEKQPFVRVLTTGEPVYGIEHRIERPDGRNIVLRINGAPVKNERGEIKLLVFSYEDITERRAIEEAFRQTQKMEAIGRLAGGVAHDFNNLLTAILSFASLARAEIDVRESVLESLDGIVEASGRAAQLTRQLLAFGRRQVSQPTSFDARVETAAAVRLIERLVGESIELDLHIADEACWVRMDPNQLQQVLLNLAVNARDAMPNGGKLTLSVVRSGPDAVKLSVSDTGHGMDESTLRKAFDPFFTTKAPQEGTGLGLSTSHGIIVQAQGRIALYSEVGRGTRAEITLPLAAAPEASSPALEVRKARRMLGHILLVEDDPVVQRAAIRSLERLGYHVRAASTGAQALSMLEAEPCDLIVCDLVLPGMSGPDLIDRVRQLHPNVRVLFVSGYSSELARTGSEPFLAKPYTPESLGERVASILAKDH